MPLICDDLTVKVVGRGHSVFGVAARPDSAQDVDGELNMSVVVHVNDIFCVEEKIRG